MDFEPHARHLLHKLNTLIVQLQGFLSLQGKLGEIKVWIILEVDMRNL